MAKSNVFRYLSLLGIFMAAVFMAGVSYAPAKSHPPVSERQIILHLHLGKDGARISSVQLLNMPYQKPKSGYYGDLRIELLSDHNEVLYEKRFESATTVFWDEIDPTTGNVIAGGSENVENNFFIINLPDFVNARRIKVYRQKVLDTPEHKIIEQLINAVKLPPRNKWEVMP